MSTTLQPQFRWMVKRDDQRFLEIERACFGSDAWTREALIDTERDLRCVPMVLEIDHRIVGYSFYHLFKDSFEIINFAVDPQYQRSGLGTAMINRLKEKIWSNTERERISVRIGEWNLDAQLFFKAQNFDAVQVERDYYKGRDGRSRDAYLFIWDDWMDSI